jgi:hypothetical protein
MDEYQAPEKDRSIREQLNKLFSRYHWIGVKNPLNEDFSWPVALEENEILSMSGADPMDEGRMAQTGGSTFLPGDSTLKQQSKRIVVTIKSGQTRMIIGEAAYVVVPRIFNALVRSKYGASKSGLARLRNPSTQKELLKEIVVGPVINNVGDAIQTFVNKEMEKIEGFSDVQVNSDEPKLKGFSDPAVLAKAQATRNARKAAEAQSA